MTHEPNLQNSVFTRDKEWEGDWDPSDMIATIMAEDAFDIGDRLHEISAPTFVIGGGRDRFYPTELFQEDRERYPERPPHPL